jgi:hypothetical protein
MLIKWPERERERMIQESALKTSLATAFGKSEIRLQMARLLTRPFHMMPL